MIILRIFKGALTAGALVPAIGICLTSAAQAQQMAPTLSHFASGSSVETRVTRPRRVMPPAAELTPPPSAGETLPVPLRKTLTLTNDDFPSSKRTDTLQLSPFAQRLQSAIDEKLGVRYRYHGQDKSGYDCSGFVWSAFRDTGISFNRSCAADYFYAFKEATPEERSQFGTLIFFNGLTHVGIVKDADHFYHASTRWGITLAKLDDYWKERITGYRSVTRSLTPPESPPATEEKAGALH